MNAKADLRPRFIWHCAKSGKPIQGEIVHLYLPGQQRLLGYSDGSNVLFVKSAHDMTMVNTPSLKISPDITPWARNALVNESTLDALTHSVKMSLSALTIIGSPALVVDIQMVVANQIAIGLASRQDLLLDNETHREVNSAVKIVTAPEYDPEDRFEHLSASHRSLNHMRARAIQ